MSGTELHGVMATILDSALSIRRVSVFKARQLGRVGGFESLMLGDSVIQRHIKRSVE